MCQRPCLCNNWVAVNELKYWGNPIIYYLYPLWELNLSSLIATWKKPSQVACSKSTYAGKPVPFAGGSLTGLTRVGMLSRLVLAFVGLRMETRECLCRD